MWLSVFSPAAAPTPGSFRDAVLLPGTLAQQRIEGFQERAVQFYFQKRKGRLATLWVFSKNAGGRCQC